MEATSSAIFLTPPRTFERAEILRKCVLGRDRFLEAIKMRGDRKRRDEIFEEWLSQLSEDERSSVECGSPAKKLRRKFLAFCQTLSEEEQRAVLRSVLDEIFS